MPTTPTVLAVQKTGIPKFFNFKISNKAAYVLSFTNADTGVIHLLERSANGTTGWAKVAVTPSPVDRTILVGNLTLGGTHYFRIRSQGSGGYSSYSTVLGPLTAPSLPASNGDLTYPSSFATGTISSYGVIFTWTDDVVAEALLQIEVTFGSFVEIVDVPPLTATAAVSMTKLFPNTGVASQIMSARIRSQGGTSKATKPIPFASDWSDPISFKMADPTIRIISSSSANGEIGVVFTYAGLTNTPVQPTTGWTKTGTLPAGLVLDADTGIITGTPTTIGVSSIVLTAHNAVPTSDSITLVFTIVQSRIRFNTPLTVTAPLNQSLGLELVATPSGITFTSPNLPSWLALSVTGSVTKLVGTPQDAGAYDVQIDAALGDSRNSTTISINVPAVSLASVVDLRGSLGQAFSYQIKATPAGCTFTADGLPGGFTLDADGYLHGTPTVLATYEFDVTASANDDEGDSKTFTLTIGPLWVMDSDATGNVVQGQLQHQLLEHVRFMGSGAVIAWALSGAPEGLELWDMMPAEGEPYYGTVLPSPKTRAIRGIPEKSGPFRVKINLSVSEQGVYKVYSVELTLRISGGLFIAWLHADPALYDIQVPQRGDATSRAVRSYYGIDAKPSVITEVVVGGTTTTSTTPATEGNLLTLKRGDSSPRIAIVILDDVIQLTGVSAVKLTIRESEAQDGEYLFDVACASTAVGSNAYFLAAFSVDCDALTQAFKSDGLSSLSVYGEVTWTYGGNIFTSPTFPVTILEDVKLN